MITTLTKTRQLFAAAPYKDSPMTKSSRQRKCSVCGVLGSAGCDCNAPLLPIVQEAIKADPTKSNRAIAADLGVSLDTVNRARKSGERGRSPETKRVGLDGKSYPAKPKKPTPPALMAGEVPEAVSGFKAAMRKCRLEKNITKRMEWRTVAFQHFEFLLKQSDLPRRMQMSADDIVTFLKTL